MAQAVLRKNYKAGGILFPDFRLSTKLQELKQYDTGTTVGIYINGT